MKWVREERNFSLIYFSSCYIVRICCILWAFLDFSLRGVKVKSCPSSLNTYSRFFPPKLLCWEILGPPPLRKASDKTWLPLSVEFRIRSFRYSGGKKDSHPMETLTCKSPSWLEESLVFWGVFLFFKFLNQDEVLLGCLFEDYLLILKLFLDYSVSLLFSRLKKIRKSWNLAS